MTYFTLVSKSRCVGSQWEIEFGDYDRECVKAEMEDAAYSCAMSDDMGCDWKIIRTKTARQSEITAAVAKLNEGK